MHLESREKRFPTVKSREHASRPGRKQSSQNKKARNKDAYIKNTKEGKNCWRNIVAGILGRNGIMKNTQQRLVGQVPRKNEANNQQSFFRKRPDGQNIVRMSFVIYMKGALYRNTILDQRNRGCGCFSITADTVSRKRKEKL